MTKKGPLPFNRGVGLFPFRNPACGKACASEIEIAVFAKK